jgi:hypothetical protein
MHTHTWLTCTPAQRLDLLRVAAQAMQSREALAHRKHNDQARSVPHGGPAIVLWGKREGCAALCSQGLQRRPLLVEAPQREAALAVPCGA